MFFSQDQLGKRSVLGTVWIAAHMERKLKKKQIENTDIKLSVGEYSVEFNIFLRNSLENRS